LPAHWKLPVTILIKLGWVTTQSRRPGPKLSELRLVPSHSDRLNLTLRGLRSDSTQFLVQLFSNKPDDDLEWSNRLEPLYEFEPYTE